MNRPRPDIQRVPAANGEAFIEPPLDAQRHSRFTALYETHFHRILGYARRRTEADEAFDVVAETFTVAWRRLDDLPDGDDALYWLYGTARRVIANHRRAERRRANLLGALHTDATRPTATQELEDGRVADALAQLRDDERELLLLVAWEGLDAAAVAAVMRCSRNAARIRIYRARRRFADALASPGEGMKRNATSGHVPSATLGLEERR
jgi:RNA polymerase sigma-70 factor, ECF subfamily